jgi:CspA family cold shock protein
LTSREERIDAFVHRGEPPAGERLELLCEDHNGLTFFPSCVNPSKGYGFIQPQGGGKDIFVHISAVERAGMSTLNEGQQVQYEEVANKGKTSAENLKVK